MLVRSYVATILFCLSWLGSASAAPGAVTNLLASNTRFATTSYIHDSGIPGPTIFICGGVHGNEPAGAAAAENIRHWEITRGKLVVVPRANVLALAANKRLTPDLDPDLDNLNRNYPRANQDESARGELATAIWALVLKHRPDWLLDLHEGYDFNRINSNSVGNSIITTTDEKCKVAAARMLDAVNTPDAHARKFTRRSPPIDGSLARAAGEHLHIPAMTVETTSKEPMAKRIRQHEIMVCRLLQHLDMMPDEVSFSALVAIRPERTLRVALYKGPGTGGKGPPNLLKKLNHAPESSITQITPDEIQANAITNYDVVVFAGGSASKQAEAIGEVGRENVRHFVERGGGYIGICAGAYLATSGYPWSLKIINARTVSPKWQRGVGDVKIELTDSGNDLLGQRAGAFDVHYANGPIVRPDTQTNLPPFNTLAHFRSELAKNGSPVGAMSNAPAIFSARYKRGRVICISPHPEQTVGLEEFIPRAIEWVITRNVFVGQE